MDPIFVFFDIGGAVLLAWWLYKTLAPTHHLYRHWRWRSVVLIALAVSIALIYYVLRRWASYDVIDNPYYIIGYLALGLLWISGATKVSTALADIRFQQDVRDRNNAAAALAIGGLLVGNAAAYAGANVGDGPGFHVVFFSALLSVSAVCGSVWVLAAFSDGEERITVDHDFGAALRLAALAVAVGIIAGRGAAGDWVSIEATVRDFAAVGWPVLPMIGAAIVNERASPPGYADASPLRSVGFAVIFIALAVAYVSGLEAP